MLLSVPLFVTGRPSRPESYGPGGLGLPRRWAPAPPATAIKFDWPSSPASPISHTESCTYSQFTLNLVDVPAARNRALGNHGPTAAISELQSCTRCCEGVFFESEDKIYSVRKASKGLSSRNQTRKTAWYGKGGLFLIEARSHIVLNGTCWAFLRAQSQTKVHSVPYIHYI